MKEEKNNLKQIREAAGFTQERVSSYLSLNNRGTLSNYELGTREIGRAHV